MPVIAMTREMGSLGRDVAIGLAEDLGLELIQHELVEHVADKMGLRESSVNRFLEGKASLLERWGINESDLSLYTAEELLEVAERNKVLIRGWGATYVLRDVPHVLCVRVCASETRRAEVLMDRVGIDDFNVALKEVQRNDAAHARAMLHMFHADYENPLLYDMVLNTERLSVEACVEMIKSALARPEMQATPESMATLADLKIEAAIRTALRKNPKTNRPSPSFTVDVEPGTGKVHLSGVVFDADFKAEAERVVREVPGVKEVVNELIALGSSRVGP